MGGSGISEAAGRGGWQADGEAVMRVEGGRLGHRQPQVVEEAGRRNLKEEEGRKEGGKKKNSREEASFTPTARGERASYSGRKAGYWFCGRPLPAVDVRCPCT